MSPSMHMQTPNLLVFEARGLRVRSVQYCRNVPHLPAQARVNRSVHDVMGRTVAQWDPRLTGEPANLETIHSLSGTALASLSVDAGVRVNLLGAAGQSLHAWDGRGSQRRVEYDELLRAVAIHEQALDSAPGCTERYAYGPADQAFANHNQCGRLIRHDDPCGTRKLNEYGVSGGLLEQQQHFLTDLAPPDWPLPVSERDALLEPGTGARTVLHFNPVGELLMQTDAQENRQLFNQTVDGHLRDAWLHLKNTPAPHVVVRDIHYSAGGQVEQQTAGNQVVSLFDYGPKDGRLTRLRARQAGGEVLQDLNYSYDPVGNILSIEDKALPTRYFANQRVEPINRYVYDSLYQLIEATGWEAGSQNRGPAHLEDPAAVANYRQAYRYDAGGNLLELTHQGPQQHGRLLTAARHSNRCLPARNGVPPTEAEIAAAFDHNGNLLELEPGRDLTWDVRNQLQQVTPVARDSQLNDVERYLYGADGLRQRKVRSTQTNTRAVLSETRYLPGLETRTRNGEILHVVTVQAGRETVQVLHWETPAPRQLANDQYRYTLSDHLGSCSLELDSEARVVSRETYHPFGTTAFTERGDSSELSYRTLRYSGKERDATGLYYYGLRYYMPWLQRWLNTDPAGVIDGLNLYSMVRNNPVRYADALGLSLTDVNLQVDERGQDYENPQQFIARTRRSILYRAITIEPGVKEKWGGHAEKLIAKPDGDFFSELAIGQLKVYGGKPDPRKDAYRGLTIWDKQKDISSSDPSAKVPVMAHVSGNNFATQYISTGSLHATMTYVKTNYLTKSPRAEKDWSPVVAIDVSALPETTRLYDSTRPGNSYFDAGAVEGADVDMVEKVRQEAESDAEVLISPSIPGNAIQIAFSPSTAIPLSSVSNMKAVSGTSLAEFESGTKRAYIESSSEQPVAFKKRKSAASGIRR